MRGAKLKAVRNMQVYCRVQRIRQQSYAGRLIGNEWDNIAIDRNADVNLYRIGELEICRKKTDVVERVLPWSKKAVPRKHSPRLGA